MMYNRSVKFVLCSPSKLRKRRKGRQKKKKKGEKKKEEKESSPRNVVFVQINMVIRESQVFACIFDFFSLLLK